MNLKYCFIVLFLGAVFKLNAQEIKIYGFVKDSLSQKPLSNVDVIILDDSMHVITSKTSRYDGSFFFGNITKAKYVQVKYAGYKEIIKRIGENLAELSEIFYLSLSDILLNEIKITAMKPLITSDRGVVSYNIEGGIWSNIGSLSDILKNISSIAQSPNSNLSYKGKELTLLIDGRKVQLSGQALENMLLSLQANEIESIDLIANPGVKYESSDKAVLNIKTIKSKNYGTSYLLNTSYAIGKTYKSNSGLNINAKNKYFALTTGITYYQSKILMINENNRSIEATNGSAASSFNDFSNDIQDLKIKGAKLGLNFALFKDINFNMLSTFGKTNSGRDVDYNSIYVINKKENTSYFKQIDNYSSIEYYNGLNVSKKLKNSTFGIVLDNNKYDYIYQEVANGFTSSSGEDKKLNISNPAIRDIKINSIKIDYNRPVKGGNLGVGGQFKTSSISTDAKYIASDTLFNDRSTNFLYSEGVKAFYVDFEKTKSKLYYSFGLRYEVANLSGEEKIIANVSNYNKGYFFPALAIQYVFPKELTLNVNYNKKVTRPNYDDLSSRLIFKSPYFFKRGGGLLLPSYSTNIDMSIKRKALTYSLSYFSQENRFVQVPISEGYKSIYQYTTLDKFNYLATSLSYNGNILSAWNSNVMIEVWKNNLQYKELNINKSGATFNFNLQNTFTLSKQNTFSLNWILTTKDFTSVYDLGKVHYLNAFFSHNSLNKRVTITTSITDVFNTYNWTFYSKYNGFYLFDYYKNASRFFRIGINWKIGKILTIKKTNSGIENEKIRANT